MYKTKQGRRRRLLCKDCKTTFSSTAGTAYYRLHKSRKVFDEVAQMSMEGVSKSSISRIKKISWNTVARWLELAAKYAEEFNKNRIKNYEIIELQADEIRTLVQNKKTPIWIFTTLEVWSRLWVSHIVGKRNYKNVKSIINETCAKGRFNKPFLFTTDGYEPYGWAVKKILGIACIYGQVVKTRRNYRVNKIERKLIIGKEHQLKEALFNSEDSDTLNTSFVERHNLTIRQGSAYLCRRSACHVKDEEYLDNHMALLKCYYNFIRPHSALKFGKETRTPAMQAGLVSRRLTFRDIFMDQVSIFLYVYLIIMISCMNLILRSRYYKLTTVN